MSPLVQFKLNARCLRRALVRGQWRKLPHFLRGLVRALYEPRRSTFDQRIGFASAAGRGG